MVLAKNLIGGLLLLISASKGINLGSHDIDSEDGFWTIDDQENDSYNLIQSDLNLNDAAN